MVFPAKTTVQPIEDNEPSPVSGDKKSSSSAPPPAVPKPRSAADASLYSSAGQSAMQQGQAGLGSEGGSPASVGMHGLVLVQRGLQMLNLAFPDNPGLMAVLADLVGRLQSIIPQLVSQQTNGGAGMGLFPQPQAPMPAGPMGGGMPPPGMPPMGMPAPPMGGGAPPMGR